MHRLFLLLALTACAGRSPRVAPDAGLDTRAMALEQSVRRIAALSRGAGALWPGFDPLAVPLAVYDGESTWLFRHPSPPVGFGQVDGQLTSGVVHYRGRYPAVTANSSAELGGVTTATVNLVGVRAASAAPLAVHEAFHVYQRTRHPLWVANEAELFVYPAESDSLLMQRRLESLALRRALQAGEPACWTRAALAQRATRFRTLDSAAVAYERGTELNEGLATYVEQRARGGDSIPMPGAGFAAGAVRRRAYASGASLALLLDRVAPEWRVAFNADDHQFLDVVLQVAVGPGAVCAFSAAERATAMQTAERDQRMLADEKAARVAAFRARAGWRVVIASPDHLLWPQGFDPLHVERVAPTEVLHARFLKLGNERGVLEVLDGAGADLEALTDGAGPHPLFNGVRRVEVAGLAAEPAVAVVGDSVHVAAAGFTVGIRGATVVREGRVVRVRVE